MANHKSAEKRIRQTATREERNRYYRTRIKNIVKAVTGAKSKDEANEAFKKANRYLHSMVSKGILKKNTVARKVGRLAAFVNKIQ
ncbi:30S ribosomal protein S20 [Campylobacterota bacterium]|nr:30S ribosomal protein S20 [Campylobacterota bacterium]